MSRKVIFFCCLAIAQAGTLGTDFSPSTAVSYSSIRFGAPTTNESPVNSYFIASPYNTQNTVQERQIEGTHQSFETTFLNGLDTSYSNINSAPTYTEAIYPQYVPSGSRQLDLARPLPASRNIPESPLPEFATAPTVLKTEGLSAYASIPLDSVANVDTTSSLAKDLSSYVSLPAQRGSYSNDPIVSLLNQPSPLEKSTVSALGSSLSKSDSNSFVSPTVSHVSVSSTGTNYSW